MTRMLNVACLQTRPMATMEEAVAEAMPLAEQAAAEGMELLCLPEYCGGLVTDGPVVRPPTAPLDRHPLVVALTELARRRGTWVLIGSVAVPGPDGRVVNRGALIDSSGRVVGQYDKIHMFDIDLSETEQYRESAAVAPGEASALYDTPIGSIGHTICYDLRFPMLFRDLAQAGAEILAVPSAFTRKTGEAHWHVLNRARAIENGAFVIAPCASGPVPGGGEVFGHSLIVDPWGEVLADAGDGARIVSACIDLSAVEEVRSRIPSLRGDRRYIGPQGVELAAE